MSASTIPATALPRWAGVGLLVYSVTTFTGFLFSGAPGGDYSAGQVAAYTAAAHAPTAIAVWYVSALGALALVLFGAGLRRLPATGRPLAAIATVGAAVSVTGAFVSGGVVVAMIEGGGAVHSGVAQPTVYMFTELGNLLAVTGPALCVGVIALVLAVRGGVPGWLRVISAIGGVCGILAPYYFTYFVYTLFTLVLGVALIAARRVHGADDEVEKKVLRSAS